MFFSSSFFSACLLKLDNFGTGSRMSCATFNVAASLNLHGRTKQAVSKPFGSRNHCTFPKFSFLYSETLNLSSTYYSFGRDTPSRSFHSVFKCLAQNSESSPSVSVDTNNNSRKHCSYSIFSFPLYLYYNIIYCH